MNELAERWKRIVKQNACEYATFYRDKYYSYIEIDKISDYYAMMISHKKGKVVGVMIENSDMYVIAVLAAIKSGCTFVPIDKNYPEERIDFIIKDCGINLIFTNDDGYGIEKTCERISLNALDMKMCLPGEFEYCASNEVAYILYTSGTTGVPKGIKISNSSLINLVDWFNNKYSISKNRNILQLANISFDVSIEEIFGCIMNGGTLYIPQKEEKSHFKKLRKFILDRKINILQGVPIVLKELLLDENTYFSDLNIVISGGEALGESLKDQIISRGYSLFNHYGPTEITVDCLTSKCEIGKKVTIGEPIDNCKCFIVNKNLEIVPDGVWGELCCAGVNVAIGYTNSSYDLDKFIWIDGLRVYRTISKLK